MARRQWHVAGGDPSASTILLAPLARQRCGCRPDLRVVGAERIPRPAARSCWPVNHVSFLDRSSWRSPYMTVAAAGSALSPICSNTRWWAELRGTRMIPVARRRGAAGMPRPPVRPWMAGRRCWSIPRAGSCRPGRPARPGASLVALRPSAGAAASAPHHGEASSGGRLRQLRACPVSSDCHGGRL
jgi:hypothetical protein